ncbi:MAG: hypothetical protein PHC49_17390 [Desulfuromonadaceae bacterium]|nr:hypothetical protein [Desulfuromonadaceae bacterium]
MSSFLHSLMAVLLALLAFSLVGCGEKTVTVTGVTKVEQSQGCIDCHQSVMSPVTGRYITEEWKLSRHNTSNKAGCADCHEPEAGHPSGCKLCHGGTLVEASKHVTKNPDSAGKCAKCHTSVAGFGLNIYNNVTTNTRINHFSTPTLGSYTAASGSYYSARYVTINYAGSCRSCHNPHDTTSQIEKHHQWARSGKGDVTANPWANRSFRKMGTALPATPETTFGSDCVRCHTTSGFITYLKDKTIAPYGGASETEGREVLGCNACHDDDSGNAYSYKIRSVEPVTAYYNYSATQAGISPDQLPNRMRIRISQIYDDVKTSNVCLACHVGREIGQMIQAADDLNADFTKLGFISSHYLSGGATIFQKSGYEFSGRAYPWGQSLPGSLPYQHSSVGMDNLNGTGTGGPCVTCHLKPGRHTFLPIERSENSDIWLRQATSITSQECAKCHNGTDAGIITAESLNRSKSDFYAALSVLKAGLEAKNMYYRSGSIFFAATGNTRVTNWTGGLTAPASGPDVMGAAFNYVLLNYDFGAYAHNVFYAKRLLYDSIDLIDDGMLNFSTCATIGMDNSAAFGYLCSDNITGNISERP